ncbi:MAG: hypothetical protein NZ528_04355 [Caldilineales bacterium]|nr:hypothetical protein [Caldilineales bacterium]MDW8317791.1 hypothetical protein [Anaerolineae bacterium]
MTTKADFAPEEWSRLLQAPLAVGMYVAAASPSLLGSIGESMALGKGIAAVAQSGTDNELLSALIGDLTNKETAKEAQLKLTARDPEGIKAELMDAVRGAAALLDEKASAEEATGLKQWFYQLAVDVANATKEGGFLGIGAVRVSDAEKAALAELADALGVTP